MDVVINQGSTNCLATEDCSLTKTFVVHLKTTTSSIVKSSSFIRAQNNVVRDFFLCRNVKTDLFRPFFQYRLRRACLSVLFLLRHKSKFL